MKPRRFDYARPDSVAEALALLAEHGEEARVLAGGQSLMAMLNLRLLEPAVLVDIARLAELDTIRSVGDKVEVGAAVTQNRLAAWPELRAKLLLLAKTLPFVGHFQTRNKGTVCGSVAHADPSSVESLASPDGALNALQQAFQQHHALQCGFCTPGILMSFTDYLARNPHPTEDEVRDVLSGHLCRCTGYAGILAAVLAASGGSPKPNEESRSQS
jgi:xanthine dehydrogenase iron-sulfur cluster and FAD-binding subunit A